MAGAADPIKQREQARELVALADEFLAKAYESTDTRVVVGCLLDAAVRLSKAVKLLLNQ